MACGNCGYDTGHSDAACRNCGAPAAGPPRRGERRQVSALFCDLVDSVPITLHLDAEDMLAVVEVYSSICGRIIEAHGGHIVQYMGDGVLAYFGYPRADEQSSADAVRAGLALRDTIKALDPQHGIQLQVRIGIATGIVVIGDLMSEGTSVRTGIVGETPNLAARLQSVALPNSVIVGKATWRITKDAFRYHALGSMTLKGFAEPVDAFEAVEPAPGAGRFRMRGEAGETPLVGRAAELNTLLDAWASARAGGGRAVILQGEAGIGKSRLIEELRRHAADTIHASYNWACDPHHADSELYPVVQHLLHATTIRHGDTPQTCDSKLDQFLGRQGVPEQQHRAALASLLNLAPLSPMRSGAITPEKRKSLTVEALLSLLPPPGARQRPTLIVLEDAHWSDPTTLALVNRIAVLASGRPLLIVITARPGFALNGPADDRIVSLPLRPLSRNASETICFNLGAHDLLPPSALHQIVGHADGNPLFVEEMTKSVMEDVAASGDHGPAAQVRVPATIHDSLVARLDRLGPHRRIANLAAVIGRRFEYQLLADISGLTDADLRNGLRILTGAGLIERSSVEVGDFYGFKHMLIRDAAYHSLLKQERRILHGRIAAALRSRFPGTETVEPELLAYHLAECGAIAESIPFWASAANRAASHAAHFEAVALFQTTLDFLGRQPASAARAGTELQLLIGLAVSLAASRGYSVPELREVLTKARGICNALGNASELFAVLRALCSFSIVAGDMPEAEEIGLLCLAIAEQGKIPEHQIESDYAIGYILSAQGCLAEARFHLERSIRRYEQCGGASRSFPSPHDPMAGCLFVLSMVLYAQGDAPGAAEAASSLVSHARALGEMFSLAFSLCSKAHLDLIAGDFRTALRFATEAAELCETNGYSTWEIFANFYRAIAMGNLGKLEQALAMTATTIAELDRLGNMHGRGFFLGEIAKLQALAGETQTALDTADAAIEAARRYSEGYHYSPLYRRRAEILALDAENDPALVTLCLENAMTVAKIQGATGFVAQAEALLPSATLPRSRQDMFNTAELPSHTNLL